MIIFTGNYVQLSIQQCHRMI